LILIETQASDAVFPPKHIGPPMAAMIGYGLFHGRIFGAFDQCLLHD